MLHTGTNITVICFAWSIVTVQVVEPGRLQPKLHERNCQPGAGVAVSVTWSTVVPMGGLSATSQRVVPTGQSTFAAWSESVPVTLPPPALKS